MGTGSSRGAKCQNYGGECRGQLPARFRGWHHSSQLRSEYERWKGAEGEELTRRFAQAVRVRKCGAFWRVEYGRSETRLGWGASILMKGIGGSGLRKRLPVEWNKGYVRADLT